MARIAVRNADGLTETQQKVLNFVRNAIINNNISPTVREICDGTGILSTSTAHNALKVLSERGFLYYKPGTRRAITLPPKTDEHIVESVVNVPVVGDVAAGIPILAVDNIQEYLPLPSNLAGGAQGRAFMLCVKGTSMIDIGIYENDLIIVNADEDVSNGDIAVVRVGGDSATVKRFYREETRIRLQPENTTMKPIYADLDDVEIVGKVKGLVRRF